MLLKKTGLFALGIHWACVLSAQSAIDYPLGYTTYLGGVHFEQARDLAVDKDGFIYVTGGTSSNNFPTTPGTYNTIYNNAGSPTAGTWGPMMVFISKFSPLGDLVWSTYLGGPNYDRAYAIEVDQDGYVYVGGRAGDDFPTTPGAFQEQFTQFGSKNNLYGHQNGFIAKLSPDGTQLLWSTYYGSDSYGFFRDIDIDEEGYVYGILNAVSTKPAGIPNDAFDPTHNGGYDMVAVKFEPDGSDVVWATFLGGSGEDQGGPSIRVGTDKSVYVAGGTKSADFPTTVHAVQKQRKGPEDMFVTRIAPDGKSLIYSTYFGGSAGEFSETHSLFVDHLGQAYVACGTTSSDIATTPGALKGQKPGTDTDGLFFKLSTDGANVMACTYFGGTSNEYPEGLYVDSLQNLYVGGGGNSDALPVTPNAHQLQRKGGQDGFVVKLNPDFSAPLYCTYFGGSKDESIRAFHVSDQGDICLSGQTLSTDLPVTANAFQKMHGSPNNNNRADSYLAILQKQGPTISVPGILEDNRLAIFPNPATAEFFVASTGLAVQHVAVFDQAGRLVLEQALPDTGIGVQSLAPGAYLLRLEMENGRFEWGKLIKY